MTAVAGRPGGGQIASRRSTRTRRALLSDRIATTVLWGVAIAVVTILIAIIGHFLFATFGTVSLDFLTAAPSITGLGGIGPVLWNSVYILVLTLILTVPLGIVGGIYMAEYAGNGPVPGLIRLCQELISSVPSIVVGLFGLALFVNATHAGYTALAGALAVTVFNLPLMARLSEQALRAVPRDERDASLALGTTKWQTIRHVVLPLAIPGIVTGIILTSGRIFGEAAALLFTSGVSSPAAYNFANLNILDSRSPWSPFHPATTLSVYIWSVNSQSLGHFVRQIADSSSAVLIVMVLIFNLGARFLARALQRRVTGLR